MVLMPMLDHTSQCTIICEVCRCWVTLLQCTVICETCKNSLVMVLMLMLGYIPQCTAICETCENSPGTVLMPMHVWWIWQFIVLVKYNLWYSRKLIDYGVDADVGLQFTVHCSWRDLQNIWWLWMVLMPKLGCTSQCIAISVTCKKSLVKVLMPMLDHFGKSRKL